ncbi:hypothetical protein C8A05DRAFT_47050 [Staphylotrichum tortipilum]|uniref:Uncharacterized protein n=1 Tax=Staphylotrichum tortipilum TaxID=2831512 RepID=A0AAN6MD03_9PEZI|nr:hypothetical protein C8A05DRAFT_47050 [Staphylotrichum longicolle]
MNLDVPLERAKFILDVSAKIVITTSDLASKLPQGSQSVLIIDVKGSDEVPAAQPVPPDLAYGVGVSHDVVTQSLLSHDRHIPRCTPPAMLNDLPSVVRKMVVDACELTPSVAGSLLRKRDNAAIHCTLQPVFFGDSAVRNIGIPLDTASAFILNIPEADDGTPEFRVLAWEEIGELAVGGYQLADGYLNRPE